MKECHKRCIARAIFAIPGCLERSHLPRDTLPLWLAAVFLVGQEEKRRKNGVIGQFALLCLKNVI